MTRLVLAVLILVLLALSGVSTPGHAQTPSPLAYWQYSVGQTLTPLGGPIPDWRYTLGGGAMVQPQYEGAKRYEIVPSPVVDIRYKDIAFASDGEGIGVNLLHGTSYRAGIAMSYDVGRARSADPRLKTLHDVGPTPEAKIFGEVFFLPFVVTGAIRQGIVGHQGLIGDFGTYVPIPLASNFYLFAGPSVSIANKEYMHSYFGVTPNRSTAGPQLAAFSPSGGAKSFSFGMTAAYLLTNNWIIIADGAYERLLGDAANSPIVETKSQFVAGLNLVYHF